MEGDTKLLRETLLRSFENYLKESGKEPITIKLYIAEINHFLGWLERTGTTLATITQEDIFASRDELYIAGKRLSTINKYVSILTTFFKWALMEGIAQDNPASNARFYTPKKSMLPRWLSIEEEQQILALADKEKNPFKRSRNMALLSVFLYAGLRLDEVSELTLDCVHENEITVSAKGEVIRQVPIDKTTFHYLGEWLRERTIANKSIYAESNFLFVTERSGFMQPRAIQFVIEGFAEKLGFEVSCHSLRNTYCRRLAAQRTPILHLKNWAGHKSFLTTYQYFADLE